MTGHARPVYSDDLKFGKPEGLADSKFICSFHCDRTGGFSSSLLTLAVDRAVELSRFKILSTEFDIGHVTTFLSLLPPDRRHANNSSPQQRPLLSDLLTLGTRCDFGHGRYSVSLLPPDCQHPSHSSPEHVLLFL